MLVRMGRTFLGHSELKFGDPCSTWKGSITEGSFHSPEKPVPLAQCPQVELFANGMLWQMGWYSGGEKYLHSFGSGTALQDTDFFCQYPRNMLQPSFFNHQFLLQPANHKLKQLCQQILLCKDSLPLGSRQLLAWYTRSSHDLRHSLLPELWSGWCCCKSEVTWGRLRLCKGYLTPLFDETVIE